MMTRIAIFGASIVFGLCLAGYAVFAMSHTVAVWSDFQAYAAKVASDEQAKRALNYGDENEQTDFDYLLKRVWELQHSWLTVARMGIAWCFIWAIAIVLELFLWLGRKRTNVTPGT